jgi:hypothetical protein
LQSEIRALPQFIGEYFSAMAADSNAAGNTTGPFPPEAVLVKTFHSSPDAEMAAGILRANGIAVWLLADDCGGMYPFLDAAEGIRLFVRSVDADAAKTLLAATPQSAEESALLAPTRQIAPSRTKLSFPQIAAGMIAGILLWLLYQHTSQLGTHTYAYDNNGDAVPDNFMVYQNSRCIEQSFDRNFDGKPDSWDYYDADGKRKEVLSDDNFDGRIDGAWRYTNGVAVEAKLDTDFNGTTDVTYSFQNDLLKEAVWKPNGSMIVSLRQFFRHGMLAEEWRDINMDGNFDATNRFDAFQKEIHTKTF